MMNDIAAFEKKLYHCSFKFFIWGKLIFIEYLLII